MTLRISDVRLSVDEPEVRLPERLAAALGVLPGDLLHWRILRKASMQEIKTLCSLYIPPRWR